jgi:hypothetical protein
VSATYLSPLAGRGRRAKSDAFGIAKCAAGEGVQVTPFTPHWRSKALTPTLSPQERGEGETYAEAVVTPPSTTMVWPVMKVEASEAR